MNQKELDDKLLKIFDCGVDSARYPYSSTEHVESSEKLIFQIIEAFELLTAERDALAEKLELVRKSGFRMPIGGFDGFVSIDELLGRSK